MLRSHISLEGIEEQEYEDHSAMDEAFEDWLDAALDWEFSEHGGEG